MNPISKQWLSLLLTSIALCCILYALHMPASVLLGCMLAGMWMGFREIRLVLPGHAFAFAQGVVGCLIAKSLQWPMLERLAGDWPFFLSITVSILAASAVLGWLLMRMKILPGSTAVWGLAPGAASARVVMSDVFGADMRLVAFMQERFLPVDDIQAGALAKEIIKKRPEIGCFDRATGFLHDRLAGIF